MPIRRRAWLTREGWYYVAVLAFIIGGTVLRSINLLVVLAGAMIAPPLFNWRLVMASLMGLSVQRRLPIQVLAGEPLTVELELHNPRWWLSSWLVTVEDWFRREEAQGRRLKDEGRKEVSRIEEDSGSPAAIRSQPAWLRTSYFVLRTFTRRRAAPTHAQALIAHVPPRGRAIGTYRVTIHRRGRYRFGPLRVSTRFPLGLVKGQMTIPAIQELIAAPRLGRLLPPWADLLEAELAGDERRHPQRGISEGDYYGLRPWQSGDSLRWVHWRTTAKLARPIVKQFERRKSREIALVLDPWLPAGADQGERQVELAISFAATAISDLAGRGQARLTLSIAGSAGECYSGPASALFCEELFARLAVVSATAGYGLAEALQRAIETAPRGSHLIVISPRPAHHDSLGACQADLPLDPDELSWIDTSSDQIHSIFTLV